jgi:mannose-6-phosphate isomerase-like protein (cupin superfamily)
MMTNSAMEKKATLVNAPQQTPWGYWQVLDDNEIYKVKKISVKPGQRLSYQKHFKREEFWIIVQGQAEVVLNGEIHRLNPGQTISIPQESLHRVGNASSSSEDLIFIEIQRGEYFGEDDIVRLEDDYGRK